MDHGPRAGNSVRPRPVADIPGAGKAGVHRAEASVRETEYLLLLARELGYVSEAQHRDTTALVNDTFAPLHGLQRAVRKEAGIAATLLAFLSSSLVIAIAKAAARVT